MDGQIVDPDPAVHAMLIAIPGDALSERLPGILTAVAACMVGALGASETAEIFRELADSIEAARPAGHA